MTTTTTPRTYPPEPHRLDRGDLVVMADPNIEVHDLERYAAQPHRSRGVFHAHDAETVVAYVARHRSPRVEPELWADLEQLCIVVVLNPHDQDTGPQWHDWLCQVQLRRTPEWAAWMEHNGKPMSQTEFAVFVEDHLDDVVEPAAADLLELATTFQAKTNVVFRSAVVLANGDRQLTYHEATDARAGADGQLVVPDRIALGVAPFEGSSAWRIEARLRYTVKDGALRIWYQLVRPDLIERGAFDEAVDAVATPTSLVALRGRPAAAV